MHPASVCPQVRKRQMEEKNPYLGIDCNDTGTNDMREQNVFETYLSKRQQLFLATQVSRGQSRAGAQMQGQERRGRGTRGRTAGLQWWGRR